MTDESLDRLLAPALVVLGLLLAATVTWVVLDSPARARKDAARPCSEYAQTSARLLPARCIAYWSAHDGGAP